MLTVQQIPEILKKEYKGERWKQWRDVYLGMSLHVDGVCPSFVDIRTNMTVLPPGWVSNEYDTIFDVALLNKFPTEQVWTRDWRKSVYKPITRGAFLQCASVVTGAIFQDSGYILSIADKSDSDYIWGNNFDNKDLIKYLTESFTQIIEDPNGVFVVLPKRPDSEYVENPQLEIEPDIWFVFSEHIVYLSQDEIIFKKGDIFYTVNREAIYRYEYVPAQNRYVNIDPGGYYYVHGLGHVPAYIAGGIKNSQGYFDSWFVNGKPIADEFISAYSSLQFINKDATHPYVVEADSTCTECNGVPQFQHCNTCNNGGDACVCPNEDNWVIKKCTSCNGTGKVARNPGDRMIVDPALMGNNLIQIINRDVTANKHLDETAKDLYNQLYRALYLNYIEQAQSGVAKDKDMEARYQFLVKLSEDLFDRLLFGIISDILGYRNVTVNNGNITPDTSGFVLINPTHFNIQTAQDLLNEYKTAGDSNMPPYQRAALLMAYNNKQYSGDELLNKKAHIINELDFLNVLNSEEITSAILNGAATSRDYQYHLRLPKILDRMIRERGKEWFVKSTTDAIEEAALLVFNSMIPPPIQVINDN